jgi:hypothetical protein
VRETKEASRNWLEYNKEADNKKDIYNGSSGCA